MARRDIDPKTFTGFTSVSNIWTANQRFNDCVRLNFGNGSDASLYWNNTCCELFITSGLVQPGVVNFCGANIRIRINDDRNSCVNFNVLVHNTTGTPAAGLGVGFRAFAESSTTPCRQIGQLFWSWTCVTDGTRTADMAFSVTRNAASATFLLLDGSENSVSINGTRYLQLGLFTDANRGAAGTAGRVIFNTTDGAINVDDGSDWRLITGCIT